MAQNFPHESELLEQIKTEKVQVDPRVWTLISHHTGNDLQAISWILSLIIDDLKTQGLVNKDQLVTDLKKAQDHSDAMIKKIKMLKEALWQGENHD